MPDEGKLKKLKAAKKKLTSEYTTSRSQTGGNRSDAGKDKAFNEKRKALDNAIIKASRSTFKDKDYHTIKKKVGK